MERHPVGVGAVKYKIDPATGDAILDDNGDFVLDDEQKPGKRNEVADLVRGKKDGGQVPLMEALFPRRAKAMKEDAGMGRQLGARAADVASLPLSAAYAGAETLTGKGSFKENLANRQGGSLIKRIANDPATLPAALVTGGGSTIAQLAATGAKAGAASAAAHQVENVGEGRPVELGKAALEVITSVLLPPGAKKAGETGKAAGKGFMQSILKPSKFLREQEKVDMGELIETLGSKRLLKGSVSGMAKKAEKLENSLTGQYDDIVSRNAQKKINTRGALATTRRGFESGFTNEKKYGDVIEGLEKGADYWKKIQDRQGSQSGWVDLPQEVNFRQSVGELEGVAQFARQFYKNLTAQESRLVPELAPVKGQLSRLYPLRETVENAQGRTANNFYPGLTDNIALAAAAQAQKPEMSIPGLLLFLANRTVKNPSAATATYQVGKGMEAPGAAQQAVRAALKRALGQGFRGDEED